MSRIFRPSAYFICSTRRAMSLKRLEAVGQEVVAIVGLSDMLVGDFREQTQGVLGQNFARPCHPLPPLEHFQLRHAQSPGREGSGDIKLGPFLPEDAGDPLQEILGRVNVAGGTPQMRRQQPLDTQELRKKCLFSQHAAGPP